MEGPLRALAERAYQTTEVSLQDLGGGFYGRAYRVRVGRPAQDVVLKAYRFPGMAEREALWLRTLKRHAIARMPEVYCVYPAGAHQPFDVLAMEYLKGVNAGREGLVLGEADRQRIAGEIVDNLMKWLSVEHKEGFGELDGERFAADWRDVYRPEAEFILPKARALCLGGGINEDVLRVVERAVEAFDRIFYCKVESARLIHGDYNAWNVMLDERLTCISAVIDPFHSRWADPEFDLYQLNNANGPYYGLFARYASKVALSENFDIKNAFYQLFTEIAHYYDAGVDPRHGKLTEQAQILNEQMHRRAIR
jgi:fructosamine-3-kinase